MNEESKSEKRRKIRNNVKKHAKEEALVAAAVGTVEERTATLEAGFANVAKLAGVFAEPQRGGREDKAALRRHEEILDLIEDEVDKKPFFCALRSEGDWPGHAQLTIGGQDFPRQPPGGHAPTADGNMLELLPATGFGITVELGELRIKRILDKVDRRLLKRSGDVIEKRLCHVLAADKTSRRSIRIRDGVLPPGCRRMSDFIILLPAEEADALKKKNTPPLDYPPISVRYLDLELPTPDIKVEKAPSTEELKELKNQLQFAIDKSSRAIGGDQGEWYQ